MILLHGPDGEPVEILPLSYCPACGMSPHHMGDFGSLTCVPCMERDAERRARIYGTTREATT